MFMNEMTTAAAEELLIKHEAIKNKLMSISLPEGEENRLHTGVAYCLNVSPPTIKNYLAGKIGDGYLAEAIYKEFKRLKIAK